MVITIDFGKLIGLVIIGLILGVLLWETPELAIEAWNQRKHIN